MPILNQTILLAAPPKLAKNTAKIAIGDTFGLSSCGVTWGALIAQYLIIEDLECNEGQYLNQAEADCLQGKLGRILNINCG